MRNLNFHGGAALPALSTLKPACLLVSAVTNAAVLIFFPACVDAAIPNVRWRFEAAAGSFRRALKFSWDLVGRARRNRPAAFSLADSTVKCVESQPDFLVWGPGGGRFLFSLSCFLLRLRAISFWLLTGRRCAAHFRKRVPVPMAPCSGPIVMVSCELVVSPTAIPWRPRDQSSIETRSRPIPSWSEN